MSTLTKKKLLTAEQVALHLGVRLPTVYAYVSRGFLSRTLAADGRTSRFDPAEVDALARRSRPRKGAMQIGRVDVSLATAVTRVTADRLYYRTHDATELAAETSFEQVAELLWTGELPARAVLPSYDADRLFLRGLVRSLPGAIEPMDRFACVAAALAPLVPERNDLRPSSVVANARRLLAAFIASLPIAKAAQPADPSLAAQLWPRLSPLAPRTALLDAALVLTADHELATSTMAARVAASARADPFAVVVAGLGALSGVLHGRASVRCHRLLLEAAASEPALAVRRAREVGALAGFGRHPVYTGDDPRAVYLLGLLRQSAKAKELATVERVIAAAGAPPNVDFALGAIAFIGQMPLGATDAIFALARSAGWIAHALEEYGEDPLRFRARAIYVGSER